MQIAYRAKDIAEAHIVANLLQANGIEAFVGGHFLQGALGEIGMAEFATVQVQDEDYLQARILVAEYEAQGQASNNPTETKPFSSQLLNISYVMLGFLLLAIVLSVLLEF